MAQCNEALESISHARIHRPLDDIPQEKRGKADQAIQLALGQDCQDAADREPSGGLNYKMGDFFSLLAASAHYENSWGQKKIIFSQWQHQIDECLKKNVTDQWGHNEQTETLQRLQIYQYKKFKKERSNPFLILWNLICRLRYIVPLTLAVLVLMFLTSSNKTRFLINLLRVFLPGLNRR